MRIKSVCVKKRCKAKLYVNICLVIIHKFIVLMLKILQEIIYDYNKFNPPPQKKTKKKILQMYYLLCILSRSHQRKTILRIFIFAFKCTCENKIFTYYIFRTEFRKKKKDKQHPLSMLKICYEFRLYARALFSEEQVKSLVRILDPSF